MTVSAYKAFCNGEGKGGLASPWMCSDNDGLMYFYDAENLIESEGLEDDIESQLYLLQSRAYDSASIQCAISCEASFVILELNIDDELLERDYSCENMSGIAVYTDCDNVNPSMVVNKWCGNFNIWHSPFIVASLLKNNYFNECVVDDALLRMAKTLQDSDVYCDELYETPELTSF
jgi:hypothetical protein